MGFSHNQVDNSRESAARALVSWTAGIGLNRKRLLIFGVRLCAMGCIVLGDGNVHLVLNAGPLSYLGTAVRNTMRVDGQNQSLMGGAFMWIKKA